MMRTVGLLAILAATITATAAAASVTDAKPSALGFRVLVTGDTVSGGSNGR